MRWVVISRNGLAGVLGPGKTWRPCVGADSTQGRNFLLGRHLTGQLRTTLFLFSRLWWCVLDIPSSSRIRRISCGVSGFGRVWLKEVLLWQHHVLVVNWAGVENGQGNERTDCEGHARIPAQVVKVFVFCLWRAARSSLSLSLSVDMYYVTLTGWFGSKGAGWYAPLVLGN